MVSQITNTGSAFLIWPGWLAKLGCLSWLFWIATLACVPPVGAQVSDHQRLGVESKAHLELDIELAAWVIPAGYADYGLPDLASSVSLGLLLGRKWSVGLTVPVISTGWPGSDAAWVLLPGDATASVGWTGIRGDSRLWGGFNLTGPSARWQGGQEIPGTLAGGSGRWSAGLSGGISRIIDPLVVGSVLSWNIGLPRVERWDSVWRPGDLSLVLSATEVFNERVSCTAMLIQYVSLPESSWGIPLQSLHHEAMVYDASAGIKLLVSGQSFNAGIGFSKGIVNGADPGSLFFSVGYILRQKEGP